VLERAKSSILPNGNFREFFLWRGEFCVFKTGIPGGPVDNPLYDVQSEGKGVKNAKRPFLSKIALHLEKVCYKVALHE